MIKIELEDKLLIAKVNDKINMCKEKNKIINTEFLSKYKVELIQKELNRLKEKNYLFYGGYEEADYKVLILYPDKLKNSFEELKNGIKEEYGLTIAEKSINNIIKIIRITLPKELIGTYEHRDYLSAVMKFGLTRARIGDIIARNEGADIIVLKENAEYLKNSLQELIRFRKSEIEIKNIKALKTEEKRYEEFKISVTSNRLDNFVSEIGKLSRNKAEEIINDERVMVNSKTEVRLSRDIKENDVIVIRGKGKFKVGQIQGTNKKGKTIINIFKNI